MATASPSQPRRARKGARRARKGRPGAVKPPAREHIKENVRFWGVTLILILVIQAFFFRPFRIPSESMEGTLLTGDFLFTSKVHYGARTPNTVGIPFTGVYIPGLELPQTRLPGFGRVERGDVVVFNYPAADELGRGVPASVPIERRTPYIKRIVGLPGDTLAVVDKRLFIGGRPVENAATVRHWWRVFPRGQAGLPPARLDEAGAEYVDIVRGPDGQPVTPRQYVVNTDAAGAAALEALAFVERVAPYVAPAGRAAQGIFPGTEPWNPDNFGPVVIPAAGLTIRLTPASLPVYREAIERHEGRTVTADPNGSIRIDGEPAEAYTFTQDYYVGMGDNRDNSVDSRFWGFIPESHIVGKAVLTFFSFKPEFPFIRFNRLLRPIR